MINHVRNTVLTVLNKENRGFITPQQFNSYAKHAQQLLFNQKVSEYSRMVAQRNSRMVSTDFMDRVDILKSSLEAFTVEQTVTQSINRYAKPESFQHLVAIRYNNKDVEQVSRDKERYLVGSNLTDPTDSYPVFVDRGDDIILYPTTLTEDVNFIFIRNPKDPKWTYNTVGENPIFNINSPDYQDFELYEDESVNLIVEILKLTGVTLRESEVTQAATTIDQVNTSKEA